jgi:hypothetical protein
MNSLLALSTPPEPDQTLAAVQWVVDLLVGPIGTAMAVIAVAWVGFSLLEGRLTVRLVHRYRREPALPQVAGHPEACVDIAGVVPVDIPEGTPQAIRIGRDHDDMHVIGHQAVGPHFNA